MIVLQNPEAAFVARVTAGSTHELRNILAIVKESAGLIEDLVHAFERRKSLDQEKMMRALGRIDAQVARGAELLSNLNRFAHSLDQVAERVDLDALVQQVVFLGQVIAKRKRHILQLRPGEQGRPITIDTFRLQMALFMALQCCVEQLPEGSTVTLGTGSRGEQSTIDFASERSDLGLPTPSEASSWVQLNQTLESLGACVEVADKGYQFRLVLRDSGG